MSDSAAFNRADIFRVWDNQYPACLNCGKIACDLDHLYGRGGKYERELHSSMFNANPTCRECHNPAIIHTTEKRAELQKKIYNQVMDAFTEGRYELIDIDRAFLKRYNINHSKS